MPHVSAAPAFRLLQPTSPAQLKILYLAKHAPSSSGDPEPNLHPSFGITPRYHYEIYKILLELGFKVEPSRSLGRLFDGPRDFDYVFSLYNRARFNGSEVFSSAVCEYLGMPYLGARPHVRSIAEDKHLAKILASHLGILVPDGQVYRKEVTAIEAPSFAGPYFVKPRCGAGSMDITEDSIQDDWLGVQPQIYKIFERGEDALVESYIEGCNVTVAVLGGDPPLLLPPVQGNSLKKGNVMTNLQKRMLDPSLSRCILSDSDQVKQVGDFAMRIYKDLEPVDYLRVDYRVPVSSGQPIYLLEFNICCNLGSHSSIVLAAASIGMSQQQVLAQILDHSFRRQNVGR